MNLQEAAAIAAVSVEEFRRRLADGSVSLPMAVLAARGAAKYAAAIATGEIADDATAQARKASCLSCPARRREQVKGADTPSDWCGEPFRDLTRTPERTCGCLLAAKTLVGSETCPRGRW